MATFVIGDIHGCYDELCALIKKINFNLQTDVLWFTGDLINGGPKPAEVIRYIKSLGQSQVCVLGNHDLVLLAMAAGKFHPKNDRAIGFEPFFNAPDCKDLIQWLRNCPILHYDKKLNVLLVHAGVLANWNLEEILNYGSEVESLLRGPKYLELYENMFGNDPDSWSQDLKGWPRARFLINCFTRMRFCTRAGKLDLASKGQIQDAPSGFAAWFAFPRSDNLQIVFGHWAAVMGQSGNPQAIAMDTGCVWGNSLSARCLETGEMFSVPSQQPRYRSAE